MKELEILKECFYLIWFYGETRDEDDIEEFKDKNLSLWSQHDKVREYIDKLEQLKQENEDLKQECDELRSDNSTLLAQGDADAFVISNLNFKIQELQHCLDEIERLTKMHIQECIDNDDCYRAREQMKIILQLVQRVKEGK